MLKKRVASVCVSVVIGLVALLSFHPSLYAELLGIAPKGAVHSFVTLLYVCFNFMAYPIVGFTYALRRKGSSDSELAVGLTGGIASAITMVAYIAILMVLSPEGIVGALQEAYRGLEEAYGPMAPLASGGSIVGFGILVGALAGTGGVSAFASAHILAESQQEDDNSTGKLRT